MPHSRSEVATRKAPRETRPPPVALATTPVRQQSDVASRWLALSASNSGPPEQFGSGGHLSLFTLPHNRVQWLADP